MKILLSFANLQEKEHLLLFVIKNNLTHLLCVFEKLNFAPCKNSFFLKQTNESISAAQVEVAAPNAPIRKQPMTNRIFILIFEYGE